MNTTSTTDAKFQPTALRVVGPKNTKQLFCDCCGKVDLTFTVPMSNGQLWGRVCAAKAAGMTQKQLQGMLYAWGEVSRKSSFPNVINSVASKIAAFQPLDIEFTFSRFVLGGVVIQNLGGSNAIA